MKPIYSSPMTIADAKKEIKKLLKKHDCKMITVVQDKDYPKMNNAKKCSEDINEFLAKNKLDTRVDWQVYFK